MRLWLKTLRENAGLSQKQIGELIGVSQNYYSQIEMGQRQETLKLPLMVKIADIFKVPLEEIVKLESKRVSA